MKILKSEIKVHIEAFESNVEGPREDVYAIHDITGWIAFELGADDIHQWSVNDLITDVEGIAAGNMRHDDRRFERFDDLDLALRIELIRLDLHEVYLIGVVEDFSTDPNVPTWLSVKPDAMRDEDLSAARDWLAEHLVKKAGEKS